MQANSFMKIGLLSINFEKSTTNQKSVQLQSGIFKRCDRSLFCFMINFSKLTDSNQIFMNDFVCIHYNICEKSTQIHYRVQNFCSLSFPVNELSITVSLSFPFNELSITVSLSFPFNELSITVSLSFPFNELSITVSLSFPFNELSITVSLCLTIEQNNGCDVRYASLAKMKFGI